VIVYSCSLTREVAGGYKKKEKFTAKTLRREEDNKKRFTAKVFKDGMKDAKDGRSGDRIFLGG
jgi:hypothetical protein